MGSRNLFAIDQCDKKDIVEKIKKKAASYTPEWRFDEENPDIGTALALVYAEMFSNTIKRFNNVPFKNRISFYNSLNACLLPAVPATGYVQFSLVNREVSGVEVRTGTVVIADTGDSGIVEYETTDDIYVTPARIDALYQTWDEQDYICELYGQEGSIPENLALFSLEHNNQQRHKFYFSHETALHITSNAVIGLCFMMNEKQLVKEEMLKAFLHDTVSQFQYYSEEGWHDFRQHQVKDGRVYFMKENSQPSFAKIAIGGIESYWIRCIVKNYNVVKEFGIERLLLDTKGIGIEPDSLYGNGLECNPNEYFPFGEKLDVYGEMYFGSKEVLSKKNANAELSFAMDYARVPLEYNVDKGIKWEWVMKKSDFKPDKEYDVTIEEVLWEYYNGNGWARLFLDNQYGQIFSSKEGTFGQYITIKFVCPLDIKPILINACETYYVRARIIKVNNLYKMTGYYISPVLNNTTFRYELSGNGIGAEHMITENNLDIRQYDRTENGSGGYIKLFYQTGYKNQALYFGFQKAPVGAPVKLLFSIQDNVDRSHAILVWEYYGGGKWKELNLVDETENMSKTGIITWSGNLDFSKKQLFGKELYWIRALDFNHYYENQENSLVLPFLMGIYENTTKIMNVDKRETEYFRMELYQENMKFMLLQGKIFELHVFVDEKDVLSQREIHLLHENGMAEVIEDQMGVTERVWIKWNCVEDFVNSKETDRHYMANLAEGFILFGNGKRGRIPTTSKRQNIRVAYCSGGGTHTNIPAEAVNKLNWSIGYINKVCNPLKLIGGCDTETLDEAMRRNAAIIRHQTRAVTPKDYEELVLSAARNIQLVRCFAGYDDRGQTMGGAVTLVILQKDFENNKLQFSKIKDNIYEYMADKIPSNLIAYKKFFVVEPKFVEIRLRIEISMKDFNMVFKIKKSILKRLENFLQAYDEKTGKGWKIGTFPNVMQIKNEVSDTVGVTYIKNVYMSTFTNDAKGWKEVDMDVIKNNKYIVPLNGVHDIVITVE